MTSAQTLVNAEIVYVQSLYVGKDRIVNAALKYAKESEKAAGEKVLSPVEKWLEQAREIYNDFPQRTDPESWQELISEGLEHLKSGTYGANYQNKKKEEFLRNLGG